jgi:CheY-like chemotaxis protein
LESRPVILSPPHESSTERTIERDATAGYYFAIEDGILGERFVPLEAVVSIGRDPENAIHVSDLSVSKRHALVRLVGADHIIEDLGSLNGIFINGERIKKAVLRSGDTVKLGHTILRFIHSNRGTEVMRKKILVVDDEESLRCLLKNVLEDEGYEVVLASGGEEAVRLAEREKPHLITLDAKMPDPDGIQTCATLRVNQETRGIPIILATGFPEFLAGALHAGADDFVTKPFRLTAFRNRVRAMLKVSHIEGKAERAMAYMKELRKHFLPGN